MNDCSQYDKEYDPSWYINVEDYENPEVNEFQKNLLKQHERWLKKKDRLRKLKK